MILHYFRTPGSVAALRAEALSWDKTPFRPNGCSKGGGVSCQMLASAIYKALGALPEHAEIASGPMDWSHANKESIVARVIDTQLAQWLQPQPPGTWPQAGDLVGFTVGACVHHLGTAIGGEEFIHCWKDIGVLISRLDDATYMKRMTRVWRPIEHVSEWAETTNHHRSPK